MGKSRFFLTPHVLEKDKIAPLMITTQTGEKFSRQIADTQQALHLFFENKFDEAEQMLELGSKESMYHALGFSVIKFFEAVLTFEEEHISCASHVLQNCVNICSEVRKKTSITEKLGKIVKKTNYDSFTPEEVHAELCYAEALLFKAGLTIIEDESLLSFIRAGVKIRGCLSSYKECSNIMSQRNWGDNCQKAHFEGGVRMGVGTFNLMVSLMPQKVTKLLDFIGFSGSKEIGLQQLERGYELKNSIRQILSTMTLLGYHLVLIYVKSHLEGDTKLCYEILTEQLKIHPESAWFLFFQGRLEFVNGNVTKAAEYYHKSWKSQDKWPQFHHVCFWELMWTASLQQDWRLAASYAERLGSESFWSKTVYMYQQASMLAMLGNDLKVEEVYLIEQLMQDAPSRSKKVAGKIFPIEKFIAKRSERFFMQKKKLVLPAVELMFLWNMFRTLKNDAHLADTILRLIENAQKSPIDTSEFRYDNEALLLMLRGACLRQMAKPLLAEEALLEAIGLEAKLREDTFIIPYSKVELALTLLQQDDAAKATHLLEDAKKNHTGYMMESRLQFMIHLALADAADRSNS